MTKRSSNEIKKLTISGVCFALCMVLPLFTMQIPQVGAALSPMHIPVLIAGFAVGPFYAAVIGFFAPLVRFMIFGMPPIMPTGVSMAFELLTYGLISGLLYRAFPKKNVYLYPVLVIAMLAGRGVWGIVRVILMGLGEAQFSFQAFLAGAFINAVPGIILHIAVIPVIIMALKKANLIFNENEKVALVKVKS